MISFNKGVLEFSHVNSRARVKIASSTRLESSSLDPVWIESAWRQEDFGLFSLVCLDLVLKVDSVDMLKFTHTHTSLMF